MITLLVFLLCLLAWVLIGAAVCAWLDDERGSLLAWAEKCPFGGVSAVIMAWPLVVYLHLKEKDRP